MFIEKLSNLGCIPAQHSNVAIEFTAIVDIIFSTIKEHSTILGTPQKLSAAETSQPPYTKKIVPRRWGTGMAWMAFAILGFTPTEGVAKS
jgi:hypothetical protein